MPHHYQDLMAIFNRCFALTYRTCLVKGGDEPLYQPADLVNPYHTIFFAHGFFSSALHECAHWLIAGEARRQQLDYGYWYQPDGRTVTEQYLFQQVEIKPQALEWILATAAGYRFCFSNDNLAGEVTENERFKEAIYQQVIAYCKQGLAPRASLLRHALCRFYHTSYLLDKNDFKRAMLDNFTACPST